MLPKDCQNVRVSRETHILKVGILIYGFKKSNSSQNIDLLKWGGCGKKGRKTSFDPCLDSFIEISIFSSGYTEFNFNTMSEEKTIQTVSINYHQSVRIDNENKNDHQVHLDENNNQ